MKIKYINNANIEIELSSDPSSLRLYEVVGLDGLNNNLHSVKSYRQDGINITSADLQERSISLIGKIITTNKDEMQMLKNELIRTFNPKVGGTLFYNDLNIKCEVSVAPVFAYDSYNILKFVIELVAPNPYLETLEVGEEIATWIGGLSFKFSLPFRLRQKGETKINIYNVGHTDTPIQIYFHGPALNPCVINNTTGEFVKVNKQILAGETLIINTEFGNKTVEIETGGVVTNAFNFIDLDSTFFNLITGDNLIEYTTENELDTQKVEIRYKNRYLGV